MSLRSQRRLAAEILKVGEGRVWIDPERTDEVEMAITREEIRKLINEKVIKAAPQKGVSHSRSRRLRSMKKKGRRRGPGLKSGTKSALLPRKEAWMKKIRALRTRLKDLRGKRVITESVYRKLYIMSGSGVFESIADMERYIETHNLGRKR